MHLRRNRRASCTAPRLHRAAAAAAVGAATTAAAATAAAAAAVAANVATGASSLQGPSQAAGSTTFRALPSAERASAAHAAAWGPMRIPGAAAGAPPPPTAGALPALPSGPAEAADFLQGMGALVARPPEGSADEEGGGGGGGGRGAWDALAGAAEVQQQVEEALLLPLTHPAAYAAVLAGTRRDAPGAMAEERPTALLFYGPPGTGKTTAAKIAAAQARLAPHTRSARAYVHPSPLTPHPVTPSPRHPVTPSPCHPVTLHPVTPHPSPRHSSPLTPSLLAPHPSPSRVAAHCRLGLPLTPHPSPRPLQAGLPLVYAPMESLVSRWFGQSEQQLSLLFSGCDALGRCVLFLDELDALATSRSREMHEASRRMLSVLLRRMDGVEASPTTTLIGATNRREDLDAALLSRFGVRVHFAAPQVRHAGCVGGVGGQAGRSPRCAAC